MSPFLAQIIPYTPLELASIGGVIALCYRWKTMGRRAAVLVLLALIANQLVFATNLLFAHWTQSQIELGSPSIEELARLRFWFSFPQLLVSASAWALLLAAAFVGRRALDEAAM